MLGLRPWAGKQRKKRQAEAGRVLAWLNLGRPGAGRGFLRKGAAEAHLGSGKTVLEGVQRAHQTSKKTETHWGDGRNEPGKEAGESTKFSETDRRLGPPLPFTV